MHTEHPVLYVTQRRDLMNNNHCPNNHYHFIISIIKVPDVQGWKTMIWSLKELIIQGNRKTSQMTILQITAAAAAAAAKSLQSCLTLCNPIDGSPSGSSIPGILQARTLEWVAISFSNAWKWKVKVKSLSRVRLLATPWTAAHQAPWEKSPSMGFSRQEYWSGVPLPSPSTNY